jgi:hypothetical protein
MEKYNKQSGVFKVSNFDNMLAFVGGDNEHKSEISIGTLNVDIDGIKEAGLHFVKCNRQGDVNEHIENIEDTIDSNQQSFIFVPHSKESIDSLIEYLTDLRKQF